MTTMKKEKGHHEDKKFVQLPPETVDDLAESVGINNLNQNISRALSEDVSYRARELAHISSQFMRHSKRKKMTGEDISRALKWYDEQPLYGYGQEDATSSSFTPVSEAQVFVPADRVVTLTAVKEELSELDLEPSVTATWLSIEGVQPTDEEEFPPGYTQLNSITPTQVQYYTAVTSTLLGDSEELLKVVYDDISTNPKVCTLLPYLVSFIRSGIQKYTEQVLLKRLLLFLNALISNRHINLTPKPYLSHLVTALLSSLIPNRPGRPNQPPPPQVTSSSTDHIPLACHILRQVLASWDTPVNQLGCQTHRALAQSLLDRGIAFPASQLGAVSALTALGGAILHEYLVPQLDELVNAIDQRTEECDRTAATRRLALNTLKGALLTAARSLLAHYSLSSSSEETTEGATKSREDAYAIMSSHFGDSLASAPLAPLARTSGYVPETELVGKLRIRSLGTTTDWNMENGVGAHVNRKKINDEAAFSSTRGFDNLADMGLPTDIFEEPMAVEEEDDEAQLKQSRADPLSCSPKKISPHVREAFDECSGLLARRFNDFRLGFGCPHVPREQLKRKTFQTRMRVFDPAVNGKGRRTICIGKRMDYPRTSERFKALRLLSCSISNYL